MSELDLVVHYGLTDEDKRPLEPAHFPKGSKFVSGSANRVLEVVDWETTPDGKPRAILNQSEPGSTDIIRSQEREYEIEPGRAPIVFSYEIPAAPAMDELGPSLDDEDFGEDLGSPAPEVDDTPEVDDDDGLIDEEIIPVVPEEVVPPAEETAPEVAPEPEMAPEPEPAPVAPEPEPAPPPPAVEEDGGLIVVADPELETQPKRLAVFYCASHRMTVEEAAQYCLDNLLYPDTKTAMASIRRAAKTLKTQGYGVWLVEDDKRLMLSKDGITPEGEFADMHPPTDGDMLAQKVRAALEMRDPLDLPSGPLRSAMTGILDPELLLSPRQVQGITQIAYGLALLISGK